MNPGPWQIALVVLLALIFFGRGRISEMMGDVGKGIKSFKKGISDEEEKVVEATRIDGKSADSPAEANSTADKTAS